MFAIPNPDEIEISILIRTKNEEKFIASVLDAIFSQSYTSIEVIIIDSGSTDRTLVIAKKYPVNIYEIKPEEFTFGYSLNYGFQKANGKYVVCLSAHALPISKDWLKTVISNFNDERVAAVMTRTLPWPHCNPFDRRGLLKKYDRPRMDISQGPLFFFSNANSVIRKNIWERVPFDEGLIASEDLDWQLKIGKLKYKIIYEPAAAVYHSHNETLKSIYIRSYREEYAVQKLNIRTLPLWKIIADFAAGSLYDMFYVILKRDNPKWFFFAPLRRFAMNYARFKAGRAVDNKYTSARE